MNQEQHWNFTINEWSGEEHFDYLREAFKNKIDVVYDIGACVGGWSKVVLDKFKPQQIFCFEPDEDNFNFLCHKLPKVTAMNTGIFYGATESPALQVVGSCGCYFVKDSSYNEPNAIVLNKIFKLTELEKLGLPKPDLIKLDVEGAERNIIEHSQIVKDTKTLLIEWHYTNNDWSYEAHEFFNKHLPEHEIVKTDFKSNMFVLCKN